MNISVEGRLAIRDRDEVRRDAYEVLPGLADRRRRKRSALLLVSAIRAERPEGASAGEDVPRERPTPWRTPYSSLPQLAVGVGVLGEVSRR